MNLAESFQHVLEKSSRILGFTGAGVSTESGIADHRSQGCMWQRFQPVYLQEFIDDYKNSRKQQAF